MLSMMKITLSTLLFALGASTVASQEHAGHRQLSALTAFAFQTFYIPFSEDSVYRDMFYQVNSNKAKPPIESIVSIAFSTDGTVVWYDHWEDGYELDTRNATSSTTEIWGDGKASNGCAPKVLTCTDLTDYIRAGQSIVIQNTVAIPRQPSKILFDGGDRLEASFPVTVTRGAYPSTPGSLMAGAVDVISTDNWGTHFEAPVGQDVGAYYNVFEYCGLFFMAAFDNTTVTLPNKSTVVLNQGQGSMWRTNQADIIDANNIIQVHLITGDVASMYEMRWYTLASTDRWSNEYVTPVGDTYGRTKLLLYNPNPTQLEVSWDYLSNKTKTTLSVKVNSKKASLSEVIPTDSGAFVRSSGTFHALSLTDSEYRTSAGQATASEWYDWGFSLLPRNVLTSQVLVGWGYACTDNNCFGQVDRSVIWVTPLLDCDIYIDYDNSGLKRSTFPRKALTSSKFTDAIDHDMSGALIFATMPGSGPAGPPVDIAAAWGQDPSVSQQMQSISLDMGTVVRPFPSVQVNKVVDKAIVSPGDIMTYTIKIVNSGQSDLPAKSLTVVDVLDTMLSYIPGSAFIAYNTGSGITGRPLADSASGTPFPLDVAGLSVDVSIPRRGGSVDISFGVKLDRPISGTEVINQGTLKQPLGSTLTFRASSQIVLTANITIDNKVVLGSGSLCGTADAQEYVSDIIGAAVTYCFNVTNTGNAALGAINLVDSKLVFKNSSIGLLAPGKSAMVTYTTTIGAPLLNNATVTAIPVYFNGTKIADMANVTAADPSEVRLITASPNVSITNTVYQGVNNGASCGSAAAVEYIKNVKGTAVTYCFNVTNIGNTFLSSVVVNDMELGIYDNSIGGLAPGASAMVAASSAIIDALVNRAVVTANPVYRDGKDIISLKDVTASDPSEVGLLVYHPSVAVSNKVYVGDDNGAGCATPKAKDSATDYFGTNVTYCFLVTNSGDTFLDTINLFNKELRYQTTVVGALAPGASTMTSVPAFIGGDLSNYVNVTGNPCLADKTDIPMADVTSFAGSAVHEIKYAPNVSIANTVSIGSGAGLCGTPAASESVSGNYGDSVTYCIVVTNTGDSYLNSFEVTDGDLKYTDKSIGLLAPGASALLSIPSTIAGSLMNSATVKANPVNAKGADIPSLSDVTASDPSGVVELVQTPSISIENTVYAGMDLGASCNVSGIEVAEGFNLEPVVYCFKLTNTGKTYLSIRAVDDVVLKFSNSSIGMLAPGASTTVTYSAMIDGSYNNSATVTANPVTATGVDIPSLADVTASDTSSVHVATAAPTTAAPATAAPITAAPVVAAPIVAAPTATAPTAAAPTAVAPIAAAPPAAAPVADGSTRSGNKDMYRPPNDNPNNPGSCMENAYEDANNKFNELVCTSNEVYLDKVDADAIQTCVIGQTITITVDASIHFASARYDLGWYVATDGGDALDGKCVVNGLQKRNVYSVVDGPGSSKAVGSVKWDSDAIGPKDACGDIFTSTAGASGNIDIPIIVGLPVTCSDENEDGNLDVSVCFTWRNDANDGSCTIDERDPLTIGVRADMYPGQKTGCYCERYDLASIKVTKPKSGTVLPC